MNQERLMQVLLAPQVSEKATYVADKNNQIIFRVAPDATKPEVKAAVELLFKVSVESVQMANVKGKQKRVGRRMGSRKGWIAFNTRPEGILFVDEGAADAICRRGKSLLPKGVCAAEGHFDRGDIVSLSGMDREIARGIVNFNAEQVRRIMGCHTAEIEGILGPGQDTEVVHRDNLSLKI
jgi:large subunit ribosomal protein L23